jgi:hypothetical protein
MKVNRLVQTRKVLTLITALLLTATSTQAQYVSYVPLATSASFRAKTIDVSRAVGSLAGSGSVSASGGATYSIPIALPPGTIRKIFIDLSLK